MDTNWYVITGAPSSGKTSLLEYLALHGCITVPEVARVFIDGELAKGRTLTEIRSDEALFQRRVLKIKVEIEQAIPVHQLVFFDRGIPDSIAYFQLHGVGIEPVLQASRERRYKGIFLLDRLPFEHDYSRVENEELAERLDKLLYQSYADLGYDVIRVPVLPIPERAQFVVDLLAPS